MAEGTRGAGHPLVELTRVRVLEFVREREAVFWVFVFPVVLALALGIAFRESPDAVARVAVVGTEPERSRVEETLAAVPGIGIVRLDGVGPERAVAAAVVDLVVEVGQGWAVRGPTYLWDDSRAAGVAARLAVVDALERSAGREDLLPSRDRPLEGPGRRYIDFLIPGLVGLNLMGSGLWGIGFSIVVARSRKLLKRFAASGMRRSHFLASYALSRLGFLVLEVGAILGFGVWVFGVQVRGPLLALAVVSVVGALAFAALGLLVAARPTTIEAVSGWMNLVMLPMWLLSGTFFSYERFPEATWPLIRLLPLTALNDALRAVALDGAGLAATVPEIAVMAVWGLVAFGIALRVFRWM